MGTKVTFAVLSILALFLICAPLFSQQIAVESPTGDGVRIMNPTDDGIEINNSTDDGVFIYNSGYFGLWIDETVNDGILVSNAGRDGVSVLSSGRDGIFVSGATEYSLNIQGSKNLNGTVAGHVAKIYNQASGASADVLALQVGQTTNPGSNSNFITFYKGNGAALGRIEGNGTGGVAFLSGGADFAEYLPVGSTKEEFFLGDIVGVKGGKISHETNDADNVMVITDRPIVVGNDQNDVCDHEMVSFIGQVPVRVLGQVEAGDWIVASDRQDGTGIALTAEELTIDHQIVGQAWESNRDRQLKQVNTAVGLDQSKAKDMLIGKMQTKLQGLQEQIDELRMILLDSSQ